MSAYIIGYDLHRPGQDYNKLIQAIKSICPTHWHCLDSTWVVEYTGGAETLRNFLIPHIDQNDNLLVAKLSGEAAWFGFGHASAWLKKLLEKQAA